MDWLIDCDLEFDLVGSEARVFGFDWIWGDLIF